MNSNPAGMTTTLPLSIMPGKQIPLTLALAGVTASVSEPLPLWPQGAPGERGDIGPEHDTTGPDSGLVDGARVIRLGNVSAPSITLYRADPANDTGSTMVVCPGGGYYILALDLEGTEVCRWLNSIGVNAVLLKYRVPRGQGLVPYAAPLQDAQRALGLVRFHAHEWKLDPHRIGIMGFSAGGHLAAASSTCSAGRTYEPVDAADAVSCRPDFVMLIYPAYLVREAGPELAPELTVTEKTPPTFLFQTEDDSVPVDGSLTYYLALKQANVPAEMHLLATGGHGYGLRGQDTAPKTWPRLAETWLRGLGVTGTRWSAP